MGTQHKHAKLIKAYESGAEIQRKDLLNGEWIDAKYPTWNIDYEYRIKPPEPKPDVVYYGYVESDMYLYCAHVLTTKQNAMDNFKLTFDGETGKLKSAEVINGG